MQVITKDSASVIRLDWIDCEIPVVLIKTPGYSGSKIH
jgi:hypothetical protein